MNTIIQQAIATHEVEQAFRRDFSGSLAQQLTRSLNIEKGNELVQVVGEGTEKSNLEAVETWVFMVCSELKLSFSHQHFGTLHCMLVTIIDTMKSETTKLPGNTK